MNDPTDTRSALVPLLAPARELLRADAVWVTVCNWADALAARYGAAEVVAGRARLKASELRGELFITREETIARPERSQRMTRLREDARVSSVEVVAKDFRWWRAARASGGVHPERYRGSPFVWQHHDLFHDRGRVLADHLRVPLVHFVDAPIVWEAERWGVSRLFTGRVVESLGEQRQAQAADLVACVSSEVADAVVTRLHVSRDRIMIAPCTASVVRPGVPGLAASYLGPKASDAVVVGWVGSFRRFHALDVLVDAFAAAVRVDPRLHLVLVGDGPTLHETKTDVRSRGLEENVTFVGSVPNSDVSDLIAAFDIAVLPARAGAFHYSPLKLQEYAAAGVAIVASDVGEIAATFRSYEIRLVAPGSPVELCREIAQLASDGSLRSALGAAARTAAVERLGMAPVLEELEHRLRVL